ncbi:MAG: family 16 glycosylhydrolase [Blastocatellia bacterium]
MPQQPSRLLSWSAHTLKFARRPLILSVLIFSLVLIAGPLHFSGKAVAAIATTGRTFLNTLVIFSVKASGSVPPTYQRRTDGANIAGATAALTVNAPPVVTTQPQSQTIAYGSAATFTVAASGTAPITIQWQISSDGGSNWSGISGATQTTYTIAAVNTTHNGNQYRAVLTNDYGTATTDPATLTVSIPTPAGYTLTWHDEFDGVNGSAPDPNWWDFELFGNYNGEKQAYTSRRENSFVQDSNLVIRAIKETFTGADNVTREYTSARLRTLPGANGNAGYTGFAQKYGRFEARIKLPAGQGLWPAFWMMGDNLLTTDWPGCGEIDVMEHIGQPSTVYSHLHGPGATYPANAHLQGIFNLPNGAQFSSDYHVFALEWEPNELRWYVDGSLSKTVRPTEMPTGSTWVFNRPFFVLLNLAVGGNWPNDVFCLSQNQSSDCYLAALNSTLPKDMLVDYVRVYAATSSNCGPSDSAPVITTQPASQLYTPNASVTFTVSATGSGLSYQWRKNREAISGATQSSLTISTADVVGSDQFDVIVSNACGPVISQPATFITALAEAFNANVTGTVGDSFVSDLAVQPDGRILIVGRFANVGGQARDRLARLNADGTIDAAFNPTGLGDVREVTVQADGKILIGGAGNSDRQNYVARINSDGTLDSSFNAASNGPAYAVIAQADGKVLAGGQFSVIGGQSRSNIARLNSNGTADPGFNASTDTAVTALATQPDGKILLAGYFSSVNGQSRNRIARLSSNGTLDTGFNPNIAFNTSNEHRIDGILVQPDGRILIAGAFTSIDGQSRNILARLNSDGTLDSGFNANAGSSVSAFALQTDGKILVGGRFSSIGGQLRRNIARLNADGSADTSFNSETSDAVLALATQADGRVLAGGYFTVISQQSRNFLARLTSPTAATQSLAVNASGTATWTRDGASPEIDRATFEYSTDGGTNWTSFGNGSRIGTTANWQMTGLAFPLGQDFLLRARGWQMRSGFAGDASGYETVQTFFLPAPPAITQHPVSQSVCNNSSVSLSVTATGTTPLSYQWRKGGINLSNGGAVSGATTATLTINPFTSAEAGSYDCVVTNTAGTATSNAATLTVNFPFTVTTQPVSQSVSAGAAVSFSAASNPSAAVQWQVKVPGGSFTDLPGATSTTLSFTATAAHNGNQYRALFSTACGSLATTAASLTVTGSNNTVGLLISEFRFRGSATQSNLDEFVETANRTDSPITVSSSDGSAGWSVAALDAGNNPVVLFTIPNGTVIPRVGHFLGVNSAGYSLANYGGINAAAGDAAWSADIPDGSGLALFTTATPASFSALTRLDAVGFSGVSNSPGKAQA